VEASTGHEEVHHAGDHQEEDRQHSRFHRSDRLEEGTEQSHIQVQALGHVRSGFANDDCKGLQSAHDISHTEKHKDTYR
jgi:hypothetical protein